MKLTALLEILQTLEYRERNIVTDSSFLRSAALRNAEALRMAREIIDSSATTELLSAQSEIRYEVASTAEIPTTFEMKTAHRFPFRESMAEIISDLYSTVKRDCTRKHNCAASCEPCNGYPRTA